ncbi:5-methylcytosine rRNA methyltransferase l(2)10685 isoform X1 [Megalopta genalis]|uniref:5-methylcytosine rRNA methyltransferase l(2)10685 isoform X1 n=2 Tax=Megalopta genalis TaxID=115081 RepID=UPI003FD5E885
MARLFVKSKFRIVTTSVRDKHGSTHWAVLRKQTTARDKALDYFDEYYGPLYGDLWTNMRASLLMKRNKHVAVINNFSDTERTHSELKSMGAMHLKSVYDVFKEDVIKQDIESMKPKNVQNPMNTIIQNSELSDIESFYTKGCTDSLQSVKLEEDTESLIRQDDALQPIKLQSIEQDLNEIEIDTNRVVESSFDQSVFHEYIPATKLKGLDDYVLQSEYYTFYNKAAEFKVNIVKESTISFPEHLHPYAFERGSEETFLFPRRGSTGVSDYYLFDGASLLPVLALDIKLGDVVLDMCAAPGGKSLAIVQTLMPHLLVANDVSESRANKIRTVINQYLFNTGKEKMIIVTENDARLIDEKDLYNKILVDVPCTTDRHSLHSIENNIFKSTRIKERLRLPELQSEILTNALKLVSVGGTVVYSTCALSPVQNDGVVHVALKKAWEETNHIMVVKDMTEALFPLRYVYEFGEIGMRYGHIVVPTLGNNWGPMYFCKIERIR